VVRNGAFVKGAIHFSELSDQPSLWQDRVFLDEEFYQALLDHPVPLSENALKAIGPRSMVIDVYIWLAYRLHALKKNIDIGWPALHTQFGAGVERLRNFRAYFLECLELALAAYPDARVTVGERGLILHPSRPAIAPA
jgi:Plasmid encoded RepA protein